jgi:NAD(P)-dependent dehydrogenase (short-subunit alcohol dehydrogenase family)
MNDFNLKNKVAVLTGGAGIICSTMARAMAENGVKTVILDHDSERALKVAEEIEKEFSTSSIGIYANPR